MSNSFRGFVEIEIGGKKRPLKFNMNALSSLSDRHNIPLSVISKFDSDTMTLSHIRTLVWAGLVEGYRVSGLGVDFTIEDVGEWVDDAGIAVVSQIFDLYKKSAGTGKASRKESPAKK